MKKHVLAVLAAALLTIVAVDASAAGHNKMRNTVNTKWDDKVRTTAGHCITTKWTGGKRQCGKMHMHAPAVSSPLSFSVMSLADRTVYFGFDSANLDALGKRVLDGLVSKLSGISNLKGVSVVGYADRIGNEAYNVALSRRRAKTVADYLKSSGVANVSVGDVRGLGEKGSVSSCDKVKGRAQMIACLSPDRRVEVDLMLK